MFIKIDHRTARTGENNERTAEPDGVTRASGWRNATGLDATG
jgi:hypothetical protein